MAGNNKHLMIKRSGEEATPEEFFEALFHGANFGKLLGYGDSVLNSPKDLIDCYIASLEDFARISESFLEAIYKGESLLPYTYKLLRCLYPLESMIHIAVGRMFSDGSGIHDAVIDHILEVRNEAAQSLLANKIDSEIVLKMEEFLKELSLEYFNAMRCKGEKNDSKTPE